MNQTQQNFKDQLTELINNHDGVQTILSQYNLTSESTSEIMMRGFIKELEFLSRVGGRSKKHTQDLN